MSTELALSLIGCGIMLISSGAAVAVWIGRFQTRDESKQDISDIKISITGIEEALKKFTDVLVEQAAMKERCTACSRRLDNLETKVFS